MHAHVRADTSVYTHACKHTYTPKEVSGTLTEFVKEGRFMWVLILIVMSNLFDKFGFYWTDIILHIYVCMKSKYSLICKHDFIPYLKVI